MPASKQDALFRLFGSNPKSCATIILCGNEMTMTGEKKKDPLHGVTLERILSELHAQFGWEFLAEKIDIRCFKDHPSVISSLKFLRRTPWARAKVERLYLKFIAGKSTPRRRTPANKPPGR